MKLKINTLILFLLTSMLFSQEQQSLNLFGENFALKVYIEDDIEKSFQRDSGVTEKGLEASFKLRLRRNGVPYVGRIEDASALLAISINGIDLKYANREKMEAKAFSFNLDFNTYLYSQKREMVWVSTYQLRNVGFAPDDEIEDLILEALYDALDTFSIDFLEQNNL